MTTSFRKPTQIVRRSMGYFNKGQWVDAVEPPPVKIMAAIYPSDSLDYERMKAGEFGRRSGELKRLFTDETLNVCRSEQRDSHPGDLILHKGGRWLIISNADNTVLETSVSHHVYLIVREIEKEPGVNTL